MASVWSWAAFCDGQCGHGERSITGNVLSRSALSHGHSQPHVFVLVLIATLGPVGKTCGLGRRGGIIICLHQPPTHPYSKVTKERLIVHLEFQRRGQKLISGVDMLSPTCFDFCLSFILL